MVHELVVLQGYLVGLGGNLWALSRDVLLYQVGPTYICCSLGDNINIFVSSSSCRCTFASSRMSASGIDLRGDLVSGSNYRLVCSIISGNNLALQYWTWFQLTSWISSHFPAGSSVVKGEFLDILQKLLFVLSMRIFKFCGVLCLTL